MIYKIYPLSQYFQIDAFGVVACLVRVHGYAGSEQYCRNAVLDEDSLVGEPVEYFGSYSRCRRDSNCRSLQYLLV